MLSLRQVIAFVEIHAGCHPWQDVTQHLNLGKAVDWVSSNPAWKVCSEYVKLYQSDYKEVAAPGVQGLKLQSSTESSTVLASLAHLTCESQKGEIFKSAS